MPRVTHCGCGTMSQPCLGFLRPRRLSSPPLGGAPPRADPWERRTRGATLSVCGSPRPRPPPPGLFFRPCPGALGLLRSRGSASRRPWSERPVALPGCALGPAACMSFSGVRAPGKDCAGLGQGTPPDSRAAAPQGFPFLEETGVLAGRAQTAVCAGRQGAKAPRGGSVAGTGWHVLRGGGVPRAPWRIASL